LNDIAPQTGGLNQQLLRLAELLQLEARAREASREELPFVIANETVRAIPYDQAVLWDVRADRIVALSGAARIEPGAPYVLMLNRLYRLVEATTERDTPRVLPPEIINKAQIDKDVALAPYLLWWPLRLRDQTVAVLLLGRRDEWTEGDQLLLEQLCGGYAQAWELARLPAAPVRRGRVRQLRNVLIIGAAVAIVALGLLPVRQSMIAPAEVVAKAPAFVRAPFAGVVDSIEVTPNAPVHAGQLVARLERRQLTAEYSVATKAYEVASAQYRQASQEAIIDPRAREQVASLRGKLDEARTDYEYRKARLERADLVAPADGVAVFNDPAEWIGRPIEIGERIMQISPPTSSYIEIEIPAAEATTFENGADVDFFSNLNPDEPVEGHLVFASYAASMTATGVLSYVARADLANGSELRLGIKGTAKVFGSRRPLAFWLLRKPLAYIRQLLT
jgi:multidrug resistance efflux pump